MAKPRPQPNATEQRTARRLLGLLRPHAPAIRVALVCVAFSSLINGMLPFLVISTSNTSPIIAGGEAAKGDGLDGRLDLFRRIASAFTDVSHRPIVFIVITVVAYF